MRIPALLLRVCLNLVDSKMFTRSDIYLAWEKTQNKFTLCSAVRFELLIEVGMRRLPLLRLGMEGARYTAKIQ